MDHSEVTEIDAPRDSTMAYQQLPAKKSKPSHKTQYNDEEPPLHPDPPIKIPEKNLPRQGGSDVGPKPHPNPIQKEGPTNENLEALETLPSNRFIPQALETRREGEVGRAKERDEQVLHLSRRQTTGRYHSQRRRDWANLRASRSIFPSPYRSSSTSARDGRKNSPAS